MMVATLPLSATGGHGDLSGFSPYLRFEGSLRGIADGVDEVRKAVRRDVKYGADLIKVLAGAGVGGGSLTYANTLPIPKHEFFASPQWGAMATVGPTKCR